ncbi:hypothetical protein [Streptomyces globisporus]|uniref:hypothetical protein n=1 Tax=Streptomyces globisporus TaxID=1908 RepID=UPI00382B78AD
MDVEALFPGTECLRQAPDSESETDQPHPEEQARQFGRAVGRPDGGDGHRHAEGEADDTGDQQGPGKA